MSNKNSKYNYKQYTMILDLDVDEEKAISNFLEQNHGKRSNFNDQLKKAMKKLMEKDIAKEGDSV